MGERMFIMNIERTNVSKTLEEKNNDTFIKAYRPMVNHLFREYGYSSKLVKMMFGFPENESEKIIKEMPIAIRKEYMFMSTSFDIKESRTNETALNPNAMLYIEARERRIKKRLPR